MGLSLDGISLAYTLWFFQFRAKLSSPVQTSLTSLASQKVSGRSIYRKNLSRGVGMAAESRLSFLPEVL